MYIYIYVKYICIEIHIVDKYLKQWTRVSKMVMMTMIMIMIMNLIHPEIDRAFR